MIDKPSIHSQFQLFEETGKSFKFKSLEFQPKLKPGEVLVKILLVTICGSDIHTIEGKRKEDVPCILGHEGVGEIVGINSRNGFVIENRVTWTIADSCRQCPPCKEYGLPEKCHELFKYGHASIVSLKE